MNARQFPKGLAKRLFWQQKNRTFDALPYPIQNVVIDWDRLVALRPLVLETVHVCRLKTQCGSLTPAEAFVFWRLE